MKPQTSEQNGTGQNGEGAADAVAVATIPTGEASAASATSGTDLTVSKNSQQLKLEMLNLELASNGSGEFSGRMPQTGTLPGLRKVRIRIVGLF